MGGVDADLAPALQFGRVQRWRAGKWVGRSLAQFALQSFQPGEKAAHAHICVDPFLKAATVGGSPEGLHVIPDKAPMGAAEGHLRRLGDDGGVGMHPAHQVFCADAAILLVRHRRDQ